MKLKKRIAKLSGREVDQLVCEWCGGTKFTIDVGENQITAHCARPTCGYGIGFSSPYFGSAVRIIETGKVGMGVKP